MKVRDHLEYLGVRWEDNIKIYIKELVLKDFNWIHLPQDKNQ
jgi:hypothetical protein